MAVTKMIFSQQLNKSLAFPSLLSFNQVNFKSENFLTRVPISEITFLTHYV